MHRSEQLQVKRTQPIISNMKNILLYTDTPQIGGAELQIFLLAKFLDKTKFTPILAVSNYPSLNRWCENFEKEGIQVIRLKVKHKHDPAHYFQLRKIIKEKKIDILHLHIWNPASCRYGFAAGKSTHTPIITTEHDPFKLEKLKTIIKKWSLNLTRTVVAVSAENAKLIKQLYPEFKSKVEVIKNGIDKVWWQSQLLRFTELDRRSIKESLFQAKEDTLVIISIAELHERKGLKYLVEAMKEVAEKFPNTKLVIVGEGGERNNLEDQIKNLKLEENVILVGRQKEIPQLLSSSDIFALPSQREAFGFVNLEAMITALPIVATKVGGIPEVVEDGKTGILVNPAAPHELAKALLKLIESTDLRTKIAQAGFERVIKFFDAKIMAEQYEKLYSEIFP